MRKINIFNRHTNSASYRGNAVSRGFNRGGGIPLFSGMTAVIFALFIATPSFATDPDPAVIDRQIVASKAYVDTKQDLIDAGNVLLDNFDDNNVYLPGLVAYDSTTQTLKGDQIGILDLETLNNTETMLENFETRDDLVPTVAAVQAGFDEIWEAIPDGWTGLGWDSTLPSAINAYSTTFDSTSTHVNGNWPRNSQGYLVRAQTFVNSLALKQNKLPALDTNLVLGQAGQSVLAPTTAGNVTQVALWDADGVEPDAWDVDTYFSGATADERNAIRYSIPTVGAVEVGLYPKQNKLSAKSTGNAAPKGNQAVVLNTDGNPSNVYTTAGKNLALTEKSGAAAVMNYIDGTTASATFASGQGLTEAQVKATLVSLELMKDVYGALHTEIQNAAPTGTAGNVAIYDANTGVLGNGRPTADAPAHDAQTGALTNGTAIATINAIETKQNKMTCAGWDSETHTDEHCWLWSIE